MVLDVNTILMELEIRIDKLKQFEVETESPEMKKVQEIRRREYENFKFWIEARMMTGDNVRVPKISTGEPSNLATYRNIALLLSSNHEEAAAVKFFDEIISKSSHGPNEIVLADESQMMELIKHLVSQNKLDGILKGNAISDL